MQTQIICFFFLIFFFQSETISCLLENDLLQEIVPYINFLSSLAYFALNIELNHPREGTEKKSWHRCSHSDTRSDVNVPSCGKEMLQTPSDKLPLPHGQTKPSHRDHSEWHQGSVPYEKWVRKIFNSYPMRQEKTEGTSIYAGEKRYI